MASITAWALVLLAGLLVLRGALRGRFRPGALTDIGHRLGLSPVGFQQPAVAGEIDGVPVAVTIRRASRRAAIEVDVAVGASQQAAFAALSHTARELIHTVVGDDGGRIAGGKVTLQAPPDADGGGALVEQRARAAVALARAMSATPASTFDGLEKNVRDDPVGAVRLRSLELLIAHTVERSRIRDVALRARAILVDALNADSAAMQRDAVRALGELSAEPASVEALCRPAERAGDPETAALVAWALGNTGGDGAEVVLLGQLTRPSRRSPPPRRWRSAGSVPAPRSSRCAPAAAPATGGCGAKWTRR